MKFLNEALESMKKGFAHSHSGDYLTGTEKVRAIMDIDTKQHTARNVVVQNKQKTVKQNRNRQSIAMFLGNELSKPLMNYMIETCQSLNNDLQILSFESNSTTEALVSPYQKELEEKNINFQKVKLSGNPMDALHQYLKSHPEVAFLACKEDGFLGRIYLSGNSAKFKLPIPIVVITTDKSASNSTEQNEDNVRKLKVA